MNDRPHKGCMPLHKHDRINIYDLWSSMCNLNGPRLRCVGSRYPIIIVAVATMYNPTWKQQTCCINSYQQLRYILFSKDLRPVSPYFDMVFLYKFCSTAPCQPTPMKAAPPFTASSPYTESNLSLPYLIASKRIQRSKPSSCPSTILMTSTVGKTVDT